jgi:molecular chaperone GrpE
MIDDVRESVAGEGPDSALPAGETTEPANAETAPPGAAAAESAPETAAPPASAAEAAEYKDRWLRAEAEMQNVRRRAARDRDEAIAATEARFLMDLVELLDDLERALAAVTPEQKDAPWAQGVALTAQRMRDTLARWNVTPIETVGRPFDPTVHEALLEIDAPEGARPGAVVQEALKGYRRGERTLRAARVVVAKSRAEG